MEIIRDLLVFIGAMFAMCIVLIIVVSRLPDENPLKRLLNALTYRVGATLLAGVVAVPVEPIPGLDVLYDLAVPVALIWHWFTFFRDALRSSTWYRLVPWTISGLVPEVSLRFDATLTGPPNCRTENWAPARTSSVSKTCSLRTLGLTLPSLSPGYLAIIP